MRLLDGLIAYLILSSITIEVPFTILLTYRNIFGPIHNQALVIGLKVVLDFGRISATMTTLG